METLLIVGGRTETVSKALDLGLRVVLFQHKDALRVNQHKLPAATVLVDYTDWAQTRPFVLAAHEAFGFTRAMSLAEPAMEPVGRINDLLGLDGTSYEVAHLFKDKLAMRRHLAGLPGAVPAAPVEGIESLRAFGEEHGYPFALKPVDSSGSRGVSKVEGPEAIERAWARAMDIRSRDDLPMGWLFPVGEYFMEGWVEGPEYSVESFSFAGRHVVVAITEKLTRGLVELGHAEPARLAPEDDAAIERCVSEFLDAVGLRDGNAHTEIRLSPDGPRIIESHDRVGGDRIMDLVEYAYGIDLERYSVGWPFRLVPELTERPRPVRAAATRFLFTAPGTVVDVQGVEEVRKHEEVVTVDVAAVGDTVRELGESSDRVGQVVVVADDTGEAVRACEQLVDRIHVVTRQEA